MPDEIAKAETGVEKQEEESELTDEQMETASGGAFAKPQTYLKAKDFIVENTIGIPDDDDVEGITSSDERTREP